MPVTPTLMFWPAFRPLRDSLNICTRRRGCSESRESDDHIAAADLEAERGRGGGVDLQPDIARQAGEPGLAHEVEVVAEAGGEPCGDGAGGFGENPGARRQPLGGVDVARQLPAVHGAIQHGACAGGGGEAVHHRADSGGGAGHAEGEAADGADRMRAPDLAARLVAGAQNGIARVGRRIRVEDHARRLGKPQGGERPIGRGKNAGTRGDPGRELEADRGAAAAEGERDVARDGQPDASERDLAGLARRKGTSMRIANATSASVEALRSTFTALPGARMSESSAKLRCRPAVSGLTETPPCFEVR